MMRTKSVCLGTCVLAAVLVLSLLGGCQSYNRSAVRNSEGVACYTQGRYDQALPYFQEAARLDPNNAEALYNLASTYQQQAIQQNQPSLLVQAENYYRACLDKRPTPETTICCYRGIATSMTRRNQADEAINLLKGWESRNQNSVDPKLELAYLYEAQGKNEEALKSLKEAVPLAPNDYRIYYKTGVIQQKLGNKGDALNQYLMAGRLQPSNRDIVDRITHLQSDPELKKGSTPQLASGKPSVQGASGSWQSPTNTEVSLNPPNFAEAEKRTAAVTPPAAKPTLAAGPPPISQIPTTSSVATGTPKKPSPTPVPAASASLSTPKSPQLPDGTGTTATAVMAATPKAAPVQVPAAGTVTQVPAAQPPGTIKEPTAALPNLPQTTPNAPTGQNTQAAQITPPNKPATPAQATSLRRSRIGIVGSGPPITNLGPSF